MWKLIHPGQKQAGFLIQQTLLFPHLDHSGKEISKAVFAIVISSYTNIPQQNIFKNPDLQSPWVLNVVTLGGLKLSINLGFQTKEL